MIAVVKRDGNKVEFDLNKITAAIKKAFKATGREYNNDIIELIALRTTSDFQGKMHNGNIDVEQIQDSVEHTLESVGYTDVAKAYILYRKYRERIRNMSYKDIHNDIDDLAANYWMSEIYDSKIENAYRMGLIDIEDLSYMRGRDIHISTIDIYENGIYDKDSRLISSKAKHLSSLCGQIADFIHMIHREWYGIITLMSLDKPLMECAIKDKLPYDQVKQCIQSMLYSIYTVDDMKIDISYDDDNNIIKDIIDELQTELEIKFKKQEKDTIGCIDINISQMVKLGYDIEDMIDIAQRALDIKKDVMNRLMMEGHYPYTKRYIDNFDNCISLIRLIDADEDIASHIDMMKIDKRYIIKCSR